MVNLFELAKAVVNPTGILLVAFNGGVIAAVKSVQTVLSFEPCIFILLVTLPKRLAELVLLI